MEKHGKTLTVAIYKAMCTCFFSPFDSPGLPEGLYSSIRTFWNLEASPNYTPLWGCFGRITKATQTEQQLHHVYQSKKTKHQQSLQPIWNLKKKTCPTIWEYHWTPCTFSLNCFNPVTSSKVPSASSNRNCSIFASTSGHICAAMEGAAAWKRPMR